MKKKVKCFLFGWLQQLRNFFDEKGWNRLEKRDVSPNSEGRSTLCNYWKCICEMNDDCIEWSKYTQKTRLLQSLSLRFVRNRYRHSPWLRFLYQASRLLKIDNTKRCALTMQLHNLGNNEEVEIYQSITKRNCHTPTSFCFRFYEYNVWWHENDKTFSEHLNNGCYSCLCACQIERWLT